MTTRPNIGNRTEPLEPIEPREAYEWYLDARKQEVTEATLYAHKTRLGMFIEWCEDEGIENLNDLLARDLQRYKTWRRDDGNLNVVSVRTQMATLRVFVKWCEGINAVPMNLHDLVQVPTLKGKEGVRDKILEPEKADKMLAYLSKYEYATLDHALIETLWVTGMRLGGAHSLDLSDYDAADRKLKLRHRPETGTTLKNGVEGERNVSLRKNTVRILDDYVAVRRPDVTDEHGREPFFTTKQGRAHQSHLRNIVYTTSQPCLYGEPCPVNKNPKTCEYRRKDRAAGCPENIPPHSIRKGAITWALNNGIDKDPVSDRMNVSRAVLDRHYDHASKDQRMMRHRDLFDNL